MTTKADSKLASKDGTAQIGEPQAAIADVAVTGTYTTDDTPIETAINSIIAVLVYHGLVKAS